MKKTIALAGNPNVGKSTVFNPLTGLKQHTGNWPGKTVECAKGRVKFKDKDIQLVDLPGCYSLLAHSEEEEIARDFICFENPDAVVVVCDGTVLERNLNLLLQIIETGKKVILCVNLLDEAKKKNIEVNLEALSKMLSIPVIGTAARSGKGLSNIEKALDSLESNPYNPIQITYPRLMEDEIKKIAKVLDKYYKDKINSRWYAIRLLEDNPSILSSSKKYFGENPLDKKEIKEQLDESRKKLEANDIDKKRIEDIISISFVAKSQYICSKAVLYKNPNYEKRDRILDRLFTSKYTGMLIMFLLLLGVFWITIVGSNVPSDMLNELLFGFEDKILDFVKAIGVSEAIYSPLIFGIYRVVAWVISVMLPPMAIFFPLFTLLEDFGYLPRVAFNLDKSFQKCNACGKQALTMCMGFGCNAAGVTGCKIIDSPRERLIAIITNNFVPCNGRFPTIISTISMFLVIGVGNKFTRSFLSAAILAFVITLGVFMTFVSSKLLSKTVLKGVPSSFTLELPPYRMPQIGTVIVRSIFDRTLFVLGRAIIIAAPAGIIIWVFANISIFGDSILNHFVGFLNPLGFLMGLDGVILAAFILGFPANEIVVPIMIMTYMAKGALLDISDPEILRGLLIDNGWTLITAINMIIFCLMHWPCGTTVLTIYKETKSIKWTVLSFILPTVFGILICIGFTSLARILVFLF